MLGLFQISTSVFGAHRHNAIFRFYFFFYWLLVYVFAVYSVALSTATFTAKRKSYRLTSKLPLASRFPSPVAPSPLLHHRRHHQPTVSRSVLGLQARRVPPNARGNSSSSYGLSFRIVSVFLNSSDSQRLFFFRKACETSPIRAAS